MSEYKRFTKKDKYGHWYTDTKINDRFMWSTDGKVWERDLTHCAFDGEAIDRLAYFEDKLENGQLVGLPRGWLETLKLLTSAAVCYARIKDLITSRMSQSKDISELFFDCPTVQGVVLDLALSELSEAKIDFNNITGFEELLNTMPHFKEIAERSELARLKELQEGKK